MFSNEYPANSGFLASSKIIECCKYCQRLYNKFKNESCPKAEGFISANGQIMTQHSRDSGFQLDSMLKDLKETTPKEIFWSVWSVIQNF